MPREKKPSLKKRSDGRFKCKYHGKQFYGATPEEAFSRMQEYKRDEQAGLIRKATVTDYALPWLKRTYPSVSDSTYTGLAIHLQHLIDEIGGKQISSVVPSDIKGVYSKQYKSCSNSYLKAARQLFSALFDAAVADGLIRSNPARDKTAKPHKGSQPTTRPITPQEREWILTLCTDHRAFPIVMTMLYAGLRPQEAKAILIERDVDFEQDTITVRETAHNDGQKYDFTATGKTSWSNRTIPLFPPLKQALEGRKGYLITSAHGERVTHTTWRVVWKSYVTHMETAINGTDRRWYGRTKAQKKLAEEGLLPAWKEFDIVPYSLRKSFCVMCRDAGVELNTCRKWMGHADSKMILQVYDSVSEDRSEQERKKVENRMFGVQNGVQNESVQPVTIENTGTEE
jgi:integrase